jgi:hypothetical protein
MAATAIMATAAASSAYSDSVSLGIQAAQEKKNAANNARIMEIRAKEAEQAGERGARELKDKANKIKGSQKAALAASGVVVDFGSGQELQDETELFASIDAERIKNNAMMEAWGYKTQGQNAMLQGEFNSMALKNKANATLLGGAAKAAAYGFDGFSKIQGTENVNIVSPKQQSENAYSKLFQTPNKGDF